MESIGFNVEYAPEKVSLKMKLDIPASETMMKANWVLGILLNQISYVNCKILTDKIIAKYVILIIQMHLWQDDKKSMTGSEDPSITILS